MANLEDESRCRVKNGKPHALTNAFALHFLQLSPTERSEVALQVEAILEAFETREHMEWSSLLRVDGGDVFSLQSAKTMFETMQHYGIRPGGCSPLS